MSRSKSLYAACLFLMLCASSLSAAAFRVQLLGLPLHESEPEHCTSALEVVGSYIPGVCTVQLAPGFRPPGHQTARPPGHRCSPLPRVFRRGGGEEGEQFPIIFMPGQLSEK